MLGLGLGTTTAIFSLVNGVLLNPLPYPEADRLVSIREMMPKIAHLYPSLPVNAAHFVAWRKECRSIEAMSVIDPGTVNLTGSGEPERLDAALVSADLFRVLRVRLPLGRDFRDGEDQAGQDAVAVLTGGLWHRRFHADPALIGQTIMLGGRTRTVVGILPPDFRFPDRNVFGVGQTVAPHTEVFLPKTFSQDELADVMGRSGPVHGHLCRAHADMACQPDASTMA
jgi:putative ABC transport system permease protein